MTKKIVFKNVDGSCGIISASKSWGGTLEELASKDVPEGLEWRIEVAGVEQVPVKNADGTTTFITKKLPLTAEQQAEKDEFDSIMKDSLAQIKLLSSADYEQDENTQKVLKAFEDQQTDLLSETFTDRETEEEKILARRGLSNSSAGESVRRRRRLDRQNAFTDLGRQKDLLGSDIRNQQLGLQQNLYSIASGQQNLNQARAMQAATQSQSAILSFDNANRASILSNYNHNLARKQQGNAFTQNLGSTAGTAIGGPVGGVIGSAFGSIFSR